MATISLGAVLTNRLAEVALEVRHEFASAVHQAGKDLEQHAKDNLYPGHGYETGNLQDSIHWEDDKTEGGTLYVDADYAAYVEFGTRKMSPRAYVTPALDQVPQTFIDIGKFRIRKGIQS